ncbi:AMP-binding protein, partial [Rheinheimera gaetbuli]
LSYRHYPLAQIQQETGLEFSEVLFNYTHFHVYDQLIDTTSAEGEQQETLLDSSVFEQTNYHFTVDMQRGNGDSGLGLSFSYNAALFDDGFIARITAYFLRACDSLLAESGRLTDSGQQAVERAFGKTLMPAQELDYLLHQVNDTRREYPQESCIQTLFEEQVAQEPNRQAVVFEGRSLSYGELNRKANELAHYLITEKQVQPDTLVGIYL